ncbi:FAD-dependent oxidoreductase domain-containing protein 1 [Bufo gargarizans]|uniref:FAD-dependent oxidoreductase domain-containing protein 1 n=1 Tax=Bufo gargarizans TaxID=30331 RepID=UPI001CF4EFD6|nr:FAD-dependent oxidoreductase domain-containing protein 1 [Bufo gargarizans]
MSVGRLCRKGSWLLLARGAPVLGATSWTHKSFMTSTPLLKQDDFTKGMSNEINKIHEKVKEALPGSGWYPFKSMDHLPPEHADIVIVGGGIMGWSVAYWLMKMQTKKKAYNVLVVERDPTYSQASTVLSAGGIRQQFSRPENIQMSLFGAHFLRNINEYLGILNEDPVDIQFNPSGYLFLSSEKGAEILEDNYRIQREQGAKVMLLSPDLLKKKFPWINTQEVALASYGLENEGWFDPWLLLTALRRKALSMGVVHCHGEVTGFNYVMQEMLTAEGYPVNFKVIKQVIVQTQNSLENQPVDCMAVVNAAGAWSSKVAEMVGIGCGDPGTYEDIKLPVEPRKRYIYTFHCPNGPGLDCPMLIDSSGAYFRREGLGGNYIGGLSPPEEEEPDHSNLDVDHDYFQQKVWPLLADRVPVFQSLKVKSAWAGYYDYNTYDQNGIIGTHPLARNMYLACGFSGHGLQQAPAVGRAVAELLNYGQFTSLDLNSFGFQRFIFQQPVLERNIV